MRTRRKNVSEKFWADNAAQEVTTAVDYGADQGWPAGDARNSYEPPAPTEAQIKANATLKRALAKSQYESALGLSKLSGKPPPCAPLELEDAVETE